MHRMMMGRRDNRQSFVSRGISIIRTGTYDPEDVAVISAVVVATMAVGGLIGWVVVSAIHAGNAAAICAQVCEVAL